MLLVAVIELPMAKFKFGGGFFVTFSLRNEEFSCGLKPTLLTKVIWAYSICFLALIRDTLFLCSATEIATEIATAFSLISSIILKLFIFS